MPEAGKIEPENERVRPDSTGYVPTAAVIAEKKSAALYDSGRFKYVQFSRVIDDMRMTGRRHFFDQGAVLSRTENDHRISLFSEMRGNSPKPIERPRLLRI